VKDLARRLLPVVGANAVPVGGVFLAGWSGATALTLYWFENLLGAALVALRIVLHEAMTHKRGHRRIHLTLEAHNRRGERRQRDPRDWVGRRLAFLKEFLVAGGAATLLHGGILWVTLRRLLGSPDRQALLAGFLAIAAFQGVGFAIDLVGLRERPFAWLRTVAENAVRRVTLIHLVLIVGFWMALKTGASFFGPFTVLKAAADVGSVLAYMGYRVDGDEAPRWLAAGIRRIAPEGGDFAAFWRQRRAEERAERERDEDVFTARPAAKRRRR
jgi:hypothetical protein